MTNDNAPADEDQRRLEGKFDRAVEMVVDTFLEAKLHPAYMRAALRRQLEWAEAATKATDREGSR